MEYLYVLDYLTQDIYEIEVDNCPHDETTALLRDYDVNPDNCSYMWTSNKIENIKNLNF